MLVVAMFVARGGDFISIKFLLTNLVKADISHCETSDRAVLVRDQSPWLAKDQEVIIIV